LKDPDPPPDDGAPVEVPLTGELDLHAFAPREVASVVEEYVRACAARGITGLRLVHGRGRGVQRAVVRKVLAGMPEVAWFEDAPALAGGWGATVVALRGEENNES
jgi:DNA-nicking Smr family endonuclease